ncbi:MAG: hypothetical protein HY204_06545 [Nitrospirae bacterium]|nr:hypothetical protein [Nitrospirota bacterium]
MGNGNVDTIVSVFRKIADRLELEGANPYRIRAYRRAATNLERLREPVEQLASGGRLRQIPGIGADLEQKILELLETGRLREPTDVVSDPPVTENLPFHLPGLDPKIARLLYKRFRIETLHDLEQLARSRLLRTLPGLGAELERRILDGLERVKKD